MTYRVSRGREHEETTAESSEARVAVRILRAWAAAYPQQPLVIRDDTGAALAYRQPPTMGAVPGGRQYLV